MKKFLLTTIVAILTNGLISAQIQWSKFEIKQKLDSTNLPITFKSEMQLRWDADSVYMNLYVKDTIIYISPDNRYTGDNIEIYFDMKNTKTPLWPRDYTPYPPLYRDIVGCYQFRLVPDTAFYADYFSSDDNNRVKGVRQIYTKADSGYTYSLAFPLDSLFPGYTFKAGDTIGFDVNVSNNDGGIDSHRNQVDWNSPYQTMWTDVCLWGTLKLEDNGTFTRILDTIRPTKPSNLNAIVSGTDANLTWDASIENIAVEIYVIMRDTTFDGYVFALETDNSYTSTGLEAGKTYTYRIVAVDIYNNISDISDSLVVKVTTSGINENQIGSFCLYPNPATEILNLKSTAVVNTIEISTIAGQIIKQENIKSTNTQLNISGLKGGIYILKAYTSNGIITRNFVK